MGHAAGADVEMADLDMTGDVDVSVLTSASTGLLDAEDISEAGSVLEPGCSAAVLAYENTWAAPVACEPPPAPAPEPAAAESPTDRIAALKDLAELHEAGVLTDAEFSAEKARILAS